MATWKQVEDADPAFADAVRRRFDAHRHKVLATLRQDGSPRVSGIEAEFRDGEVWLGMMPDSRKARDLLADPRLALHSGTEDPPDDPAPGTVFDAKLSGRAVEASAPDAGDGPPARVFRIDLSEVVLVALGDPGDHLLITVWSQRRGVRATKVY